MTHEEVVETVVESVRAFSVVAENVQQSVADLIRSLGAILHRVEKIEAWIVEHDREPWK